MYDIRDGNWPLLAKKIVLLNQSVNNLPIRAFSLFLQTKATLRLDNTSNRLP